MQWTWALLVEAAMAVNAATISSVGCVMVGVTSEKIATTVFDFGVIEAKAMVEKVKIKVWVTKVKAEARVIMVVEKPRAKT